MTKWEVEIVLKDSSGVLQKLENFSKGGFPGGSGGGGTSGESGGIWKKMTETGVGQLLKLGGIALGIDALVSVATKSSTILEGSLKIAQQSFMLVLRPFGDLIGLALRPLALLMLAFAIPYYRMWGPYIARFAEGIINISNGNWLKGLGNIFGVDPNAPGSKAISGVLNTINIDTKPIQDAVAKFASDLGIQLVAVPIAVMSKFSNLITDLSTNFGNLPGMFLKTFLQLGSDITNTLFDLPNTFLQGFLQLESLLATTLSDIPSTFLSVFKVVAKDIGDELSHVGAEIHSAITAALNSATQGTNVAPGLIPGIGAGNLFIHPSAARSAGISSVTGSQIT